MRKKKNDKIVATTEKTRIGAEEYNTNLTSGTTLP